MSARKTKDESTTVVNLLLTEERDRLRAENNECGDMLSDKLAEVGDKAGVTTALPRTLSLKAKVTAICGLIDILLQPDKRVQGWQDVQAYAEKLGMKIHHGQSPFSALTTWMLAMHTAFRGFQQVLDLAKTAGGYDSLKNGTLRDYFSKMFAEREQFRADSQRLEGQIKRERSFAAALVNGVLQRIGQSVDAVKRADKAPDGATQISVPDVLASLDAFIENQEERIAVKDEIILDREETNKNLNRRCQQLESYQSTVGRQLRHVGSDLVYLHEKARETDLLKHRRWAEAITVVFPLAVTAGISIGMALVYFGVLPC